ncbi:MAG TPA: hypothetical protein VH496_01680 [Mycobacterium sp.]|jgi:serine/threonine-protein kinase
MGTTRHLSNDARRRAAPAALGVVALGALGGIAVYLDAPHQGSQAVHQVEVSAVATTTDTTGQPASDAGSAPAAKNLQGVQGGSVTGALSAQEQQLIGILPSGYGPNSCQPVTKRPTNAIATVDCGQNSGQGGPALARYSLYPDSQSLEASFTNRTLNDITVVSCPNGNASPGKWHYGAQGETVGSIVCGTDPDNNNSPVVGWTDDTTLLQAVVEGPDLDALYAWWEHPGPAAPNSIRGSQG